MTAILPQKNLTDKPPTAPAIGQPTKVEQFVTAFASPRLSMGACPAHRLFWQNQITAYHRALKAAMVNPILRSGGDR